MDETRTTNGFSRRTLVKGSATAVAASAAAAAVGPVGAAAAPARYGRPVLHDAPRINAGTGASPLTPQVLRAMSTDVVPTDDPAFLDLFRRTEKLAGRVMKTKSDVLLTHAEAIMCLEAAFRSVTRPGMTALNLVSGIYGAGQTTWLEEYGATVIEIQVPFNEEIDPASVREALEQHPEIEFVSMIHVDTPSGTKNAIEEICPIAKEFGAVSLVDSASTYAGMPLYPDAWGADIAVGASQKCLASPLGVGIISVSDDAWDLIGRNPSAPRASFLSLLDWKERWFQGGVLPPGASPTIIYGVYGALEQLFDRGVRETFALHARAARAFRAGATAMGLELFAAREEIAADTATTLRLPAGLTTVQVRNHLRQRYSVAMGGTTFSGDPSGATIRVGHMGTQTKPKFVLDLLRAIGEGLDDLGADVDVAAGRAAAQAVFRGS
jgi:pyridoxamine--pyruvate transaminase